MGTSHTHQAEIQTGERFAFGANWRRFLSVLDDHRIEIAETSLRDMLEVDTLSGKTFLDIGSGSGLFSLAARRLGARVHSFDYDPQSVACTRELKRGYFPNDPDWFIEEASVLDNIYLQKLGVWDVVYSWGVLHHTGAMWEALKNVCPLVTDGGKLFIALYNDHGWVSKCWRSAKRIYNKLPTPVNGLFALAIFVPLEIRYVISHAIKRQLRQYLQSIVNYRTNRGMSWFHDKLDWIGGYPYEVSTPEQVTDFFTRRGFTLAKLDTHDGGLDCTEYVFQKMAVAQK